jgi:hypothetical protein
LERLFTIRWPAQSAIGLMVNALRSNLNVPKVGLFTDLRPALSARQVQTIRSTVREAIYRLPKQANPHRCDVLHPPLCRDCLRPCWYERVPSATGFMIVAQCHACNYKPPIQRCYTPSAFTVPVVSIPIQAPRKSDACPVCGEAGATEVHHLAPFEFFGEEAHRWPTIRICNPCHMRWHRLMSGPSR